MKFAPVPQTSKSQINKAGKSLLKNKDDVDALDIVGKWRACHAYPINTFQATLRRKLSKLKKDAIVAQRLKRMSTIIDKLHRYPNMKLITMQDIGGVRAIVNSTDEVYKLASEYRDKSRFSHELVHEKDYIEKPKDPDGYRSLHLIYKYANPRAPDYKGLLLELQIRTKLQHTWATAVETMGTFLGQAFKSRQGDEEWLKFFAMVSSAFAYQEKTNRVPQYSQLSKRQTYEAVAKAERGLRALEKMKGFSSAAQAIAKNQKQGKIWYYHLIILNSLDKSVEITAYNRDSVNQAVSDYAKAESRANQGEKIEPVLVAAGRLDELRRAYPNFFLDISDFVLNVEEIVQPSQSQSKRNMKIRDKIDSIEF